MPQLRDERGRFMSSSGNSLTDAVKALSRRIVRQEVLQKAEEAAGYELVTAVAEMLNKSGSGNWYRSKTGNGWHQASAPGEPPAPDREKLLHSARSFRIGGHQRVQVEQEAAIKLELGTQQMAPRPYMRPAKEKAKAKMNEATRRVFVQFLGGRTV